MRKLWDCSGWELQLPADTTTGLRLSFEAGVDAEVRRACTCFARWLRREYEFPRRITIWFCSTKTVCASTGEAAVSTFWGPSDDRKAPNVRIAVGDYEALVAERGQDSALTENLRLMALMLSYYFQWLKALPESVRQVEYYANAILNDYAQTRERP